MDGFALTAAERSLLSTLRERGVPYLIIGLGAALLEGAPVATQDLNLWFERIDDERIRLAAADAGGFWIPAFGMRPPGFGGDGLARIDVVLTAHGLEPFAVEHARAKDASALPALEATLRARASKNEA